MRAGVLLLLLAAPLVAGGPDAPDPETLRAGLLAPGRAERERAAAAVRDWARLDPAGAAALWDTLDLRGRTELVRALAGAGTEHAAKVALGFAGAPEPEIFQALLHGLAEGGGKPLFTELPEGLPPARVAAIGELRFRWRVEEEFARLKSSSGPTGHYAGQFKRLKALGPGVVPFLFDLVEDRAHPFPNEGAEGPYRAIHPGMVRYGPYEVRDMAAHAFSEVLDRADEENVDRLQALQEAYWGGEDEIEREDMAPALAFALFDLGRPGPVRNYIRWLHDETNDFSVVGLHRYWELGYAYIRIGRYDEGEAYYKRALDASDSKALAAYNLACNYAMRSREDPRMASVFRGRALYYLTLAIHTHNYGDWGWMEEDGDLDAIRKEPQYQALLEHLKRKYPARKKGEVSKNAEEFLVPRRDGK